MYYTNQESVFNFNQFNDDIFIPLLKSDEELLDIDPEFFMPKRFHGVPLSPSSSIPTTCSGEGMITSMNPQVMGLKRVVSAHPGIPHPQSRMMMHLPSQFGVDPNVICNDPFVYHYNSYFNNNHHKSTPPFVGNTSQAPMRNVDLKPKLESEDKKVLENNESPEKKKNEYCAVFNSPVSPLPEEGSLLEKNYRPYGFGNVDHRTELERDEDEIINSIEQEFGDEDEVKSLKGLLSKRKHNEIECGLDELPIGFKLPASKSPIMEAMSFCAIKGWGIELQSCKDENDTPASVVFKVTDFDKYYKYSSAICSKQNPTEDIGSRVKSLRRWFTNFPKKRDRKENPQFLLEVKADVAKKVYDMIEKYKCFVNVQKRRRMK